MHELAVTENILNIALAHANANQACQVTDVHLVIGQLSTVIDESVQFYWEMVSEGTICAGSKLHFTRVPAELRCMDCNTRYNIPQDLTPCPNCNSGRVEVVEGDDFFLDSIEIAK